MNLERVRLEFTNVRRDPSLRFVQDDKTGCSTWNIMQQRAERLPPLHLSYHSLRKL